MRRFGVLLVVATLAAGLVGCGDDSPTNGGGGGRAATTPPTTVSATSTDSTDGELVQDLRAAAARWLDGLRSPGSTPLACPGQINARVESSSADARGCLWQHPQGTVYLRVQNLSRVPVSVMFSNYWTTLDPGVTQDYVLQNPRLQQFVGVKANVEAALTRAALDYVQGKLTSPGRLVWKECAAQLTVSCIFTALGTILPQQVRWRGFTIPARRVVDAIGQIWTYAPLVEAITKRAAPAGTLTFVPT